MRIRIGYYAIRMFVSYPDVCWRLWAAPRARLSGAALRKRWGAGSPGLVVMGRTITAILENVTH